MRRERQFGRLWRAAALLALAAALPVIVPAAGASVARARQTSSKTKQTAAEKRNAKAEKKVAAKAAKAAKPVKTSSRRKTPSQTAPTADRISAIQTALASKGMYQGEPSGRWDDNTVTAMRSFQSARGLNPSGKIDALTLEKLGLGSDTAGQGAPTPMPEGAAGTGPTAKLATPAAPGAASAAASNDATIEPPNK